MSEGSASYSSDGIRRKKIEITDELKMGQTRSMRDLGSGLLTTLIRLLFPVLTSSMLLIAFWTPGARWMPSWENHPVKTLWSVALGLLVPRVKSAVVLFQSFSAFPFRSIWRKDLSDNPKISDIIGWLSRALITIITKDNFERTERIYSLSHQLDNFIRDFWVRVCNLLLAIKFHVPIYFAQEHVSKVTQIIIKVLKRSFNIIHISYV